MRKGVVGRGVFEDIFSRVGGGGGEGGGEGAGAGGERKIRRLAGAEGWPPHRRVRKTTPNAKGQSVTEFESALALFLQDRNDAESQSKFYNLFLNATFFLPTVGEQTEAGEGNGEEKEYAVPLVVEAEGSDYLMLFDSAERLRTWAQEEVSFVEVPGHVLAATATPQLHWALNVGSEFEAVPAGGDLLAQGSGRALRRGGGGRGRVRGAPRADAEDRCYTGRYREENLCPPDSSR